MSILRIAIDPASVSSGYVYSVDGGPKTFGQISGIENITTAPFFALADIGRVIVAIECPDWKGKGTEVVRAAAIAWERSIKTHFPRRYKLARVSPRKWIRALGMQSKGVDPVDLYLPWAANHVGITASKLGPDAAAAICIYYHEFERVGR